MPDNALWSPDAIPGTRDNPLAQPPTWAQAATQTSNAVNDWIAGQRAQSAAMGLWGPQGITPVGARAAAMQVAMAPVLGTTGPKGASLDNPAFAEWFGKSQVVDEVGKPLVVYHGTNADFESFDKDMVKSKYPYSIGLHFTDRPSEASVYAHGGIDQSLPPAEGANVQPVHLRMHNPLVIKTDQPAASMEADLNRNDIIRQVVESRRAGIPYDGVIIKRERGDGYDGANYIVFDPTQIKSAIGNRGTFSPTDPRITYGAAGLATAGAAATSSNTPQQ